MRMSIEDYIKIIKNWLYKGTNGLTNTKLGYVEGWFHKTDKEAFETAIDIMRKYQKIQEIINNAKDSDGAVKYNWLYEQISGVMEDGTD